MQQATIFPRPRQLRRFDATSRFDGPIDEGHDLTLPAQGYRLHIDDNGAALVYADDAGRRYGHQTIQQLRDPDGLLPTVELFDHPDFEVRGFMLDVSRDRVPTRATLERLVAILALARYNHLELYVEHTFAYRDHEEVWRNASPLSADDLRWLDDLCDDHGIELVANQNCFGHMGRWLALDRYRNRADSPDGVEVVAGFRLPPTVLAPTDDNARFVLDLVHEQMAALRTNRIDVGCDETFELGRGESAARAAEVGRVGVYLEHLQRIVGPLLAEGRAVNFWGDVIAADPGRVSDLPAGDLTAMVWNYDAPGAPTPYLPPSFVDILSELGIDLATPTDFATRVVPFAEAGLTFWVAPGTSSWQSLVGRWDNARLNLLDAAVAGHAYGAAGYLVTDWGDNGHHQPPSVSDLPALYGGAVSWCAETNADLDVAAVADRYVYLDPSATIGRVLATIGQVGSQTGRIARNVSPIFAALFPHQVHLVGGELDPAALDDVVATLERARDDLHGAHPRCEDASIVLDELDVAIGLARHGASRMAVEAGFDERDRSELRAELVALADRYRAAWLSRSRPGGLDDSVGHLEATINSYDTTGD